MIPSKSIMMCALCTKIIMENKDLDKALSQLAIENNVPQISLGLDIIKSGMVEHGFLCDGCFKLLSQASPIKKKVHRAFKLGNSCGILVSRKWLDKKVVAFLVEE